MSAAAVFERRNKQIQDAIDGQNLKQALQLCEKRLKKGENTHYLRAWKAHILFCHADDVHRQRGIDETLELCHLTPPVTDVDALDMLHNTLKKLEKHADTARAIWAAAAKAIPQQPEIQLRWFTYASEAGDWKAAQKAAMSLQNNFPKTRKYYFWAIFMCYLIAVDPANSDADRKLFGTLAYRMVAKAASNVPVDPKELLSPPRAIQTAEELLLLIKIFQTQGRYGEIVSLLNSENLGIKSSIAQNEWTFVRAKLDNLEKAGLWEDALAFTRELLTLPDDVTNDNSMASFQEKDDWGVWRLLLTATERVGKSETERDTQEFIARYVTRQPKSRNAQLARLEVIQQRVLTKNLTAAELLSECKIYFDRNSNKLYCFHDLRRYLATLDSKIQDAFLDYISKNVNPEAEGIMKQSNDVTAINTLKFEYCFHLSFRDDDSSRRDVEDFICRCLRMYRSSRQPDSSDSPSSIESQPRDDLCLLAVMSLIRLSDSKLDRRRDAIPDPVLIQAAGLLEHLIASSPHNYEALLLLVRIYLLLGAGSLALKAFSKLAVKQMQYETVAHNLLTRISTIHPHATPAAEELEKDFSPQAIFKLALSFFQSSEMATAAARTSGLEHGSYLNVEGSIDLQKSLKNSICRKMWVLETGRIQHLVGGSPVSIYDEDARDSASKSAPTIDRRNFDGFMNCEPPGQPSFEEHVRLGPLIRECGVRAMMATDMLFALLTRGLVKGKMPTEIDPSAYGDFNLDLSDAELTSTETDNIKIHLILLKLTSMLTGKHPINSNAPSNSIDCLISQVESWMTHKLATLSAPDSICKETIPLQPSVPSTPSPAPSWRFFHSAFSILETLKAVSLFIQFASRAQTSNPLKDKSDNFKTLANQVAEAIKTNSRYLKTRITKSGMLGKLMALVASSDDSDGDGDSNTGGSSDTKNKTPGRLLMVGNEIRELVDTASVELFCGSLMESWDEALDGIIGLSLETTTLAVGRTSRK